MSKVRRITDPAFIWGSLFQPENGKETRKNGLRTMIFGSTTAGNLVLNSLSKLEQRHPGIINLIAAATDDPLDPANQISIRKRIWSKYSAAEMESLFNLVINSCNKTGIPCYTGNIKTDAFHRLFEEWDPELVIVCCFGQRIDEFLFTYPAYGMYNFHPSDLASNIGQGPRPFEVTISQNRTASKMIVHHVNEIIDGGPIVGSSPPVNICLENGKYPGNLLTLQEKIPSICGWMSVELVRSIHTWKTNGHTAPFAQLDFESLIPEKIKEMLMLPALDDINTKYELPEHDLLK